MMGANMAYMTGGFWVMNVGHIYATMDRLVMSLTWHQDTVMNFHRPATAL